MNDLPVIEVAELSWTDIVDSWFVNLTTTITEVALEKLKKTK